MGYSDKEKVTDLLSKLKALELDRSDYESEWEEIAKFCNPRRQNFSWIKSGDKRHNRQVYDGTAQRALRLLADGLQGYHMSRADDWFKIELERLELLSEPGVREWLDRVEAIFYHVFAESNFYEALSTILADGGSIGTATLYVEADQATGNLVFLPRHPKEIYLAQNRYMQVDTVVRRFMMPAREAVKFFGEDAFARRDLELAKDFPFRDWKMLHFVHPREDRDFLKLDKLNMPFASVYVWEDESRLMREGGYRTHPYVPWRWRVNSDETYGRSPAWDALSDIKRSNIVAKTDMQARQLAVEPPVMVPGELVGKVQLSPKGMNPYATPDRQVFPINLGQNFQAGTEQELLLQKAINDHFMTDVWLMMNANAGNKITATQASEMQSEKMAILGAIVGRINSELLDPIFDRVFDILADMGMIPPPPAALQGRQLKINYVGPLAQKQRQFHQLSGVNSALQQYLPLLQLKPELADIPDWDGLGRHILQHGGMPSKLLRKDRQIAEDRARRAEAAAIENQKQEALMQMEGYDKLRKGVEPGSAIEKMGGMTGGQGA